MKSVRISSVKKMIRGRESKRRENRGGESVCPHQQSMAVSGRTCLPALGAPGLWPRNENLFEFTFKLHSERLEKQYPTDYFY